MLTSPTWMKEGLNPQTDTGALSKVLEGGGRDVWGHL